MSRRAGAGFSLIELLVAIFVLAIALMGAIGAIYAAGRSSSRTCNRLVAADIARVALADLHYQVEIYSSGYTIVPDLADITGPAVAGDELGPAGYQKRQDYHLVGGTRDYSYGWLWRVHSFNAATNLYSVDVWVYRHPDQIWGKSGTERVEALERESLFYLRSELEVRKP